jgi:hypothetical protein
MKNNPGLVYLKETFFQFAFSKICGRENTEG